MGKRLLCLGLSVLLSGYAAAQETFLQSGTDEYHLLQRLETRSGELSDELFLNTQPVSRKDAVRFLREEQSNTNSAALSNIDYYNINRAISISGEWVPPNGDGAIDSRHSLFQTIYRKQPDFLNINRDGFFLAANPVLSFQGLYERDQPRTTLFNTTQGAEIRGRISDWVGFYIYLANNYEEPPSYVNDWINRWGAVPGAGRFNRSGNGYQYLQARGYVNVPLIKDHVSLSLGYDRHFIGDGYRSLFLSDFSEGAAFARINTRIWKLNYQNLYLVLKPQSFAGEPSLSGHKYATAHYLSLNVTRWLNVGIFETVTFSRGDRYEFGYMNPIILYRAIERGMGSPDKVSLGLSLKAITMRHLSLYSQILINEFTSKELFSGKGYWANKWGLQFGAKYFDALTIRNLDLQGEVNIVRPYTYQHYAGPDNLTIANNTHYNQPLAHPLGAGFAEVTGNVFYQPMPGLSINARAMYYKQGIDTGGSNYGSNIFLNYNTRPGNYGVKLINGPEASCMLLSLNASYELRPRLYADIGGTYRNYKVEGNILPEQNTLFFSAGLRLNLARKDYSKF
jgi:hypothetical protein